MSKDTPLTVRVEDDEIVIRLGIDTLKNLTENLESFENAVTVTDPRGWAQAVADTINDSDEENGLKTLGEEMFEAAIDEASTQGGKWLEIEGSEDE